MVLSEGCIQYVADSHISLNSSSKALSLSKTSKIVFLFCLTTGNTSICEAYPKYFLKSQIEQFPILTKLTSSSFGMKYSRMDLVKFVKDSL